ncbi:MAG: response regulator [Dehalococcoidia bacterium]
MTGERILVVEDEPAILNLVREVLAEEGYEVTHATNGADALQAIAVGATFDLVVLDMWMPVVNGWQFAAALTERGLRVPLLVMTAASSHAPAYARDIGAIGFIGKPFDVDQLVLAVRNAVEADGHVDGLDRPSADRGGPDPDFGAAPA